MPPTAAATGSPPVARTCPMTRPATSVSALSPTRVDSGRPACPDGQTSRMEGWSDWPRPAPHRRQRRGTGLMGNPDELPREALPIPDRPHEGEIPLDAKDPSAKFAPIEPLRPPAGAPNVLIVLLD